MRVVFRVHGPLLCDLDHVARNLQRPAAVSHATLLYSAWTRPLPLSPFVQSRIRSLHTPVLPFSARLFCTVAQRIPMPAYCLQDCHYFYRSALRLLSISTSISPLYA